MHCLPNRLHVKRCTGGECAGSSSWNSTRRSTNYTNIHAGPDIQSHQCCNNIYEFGGSGNGSRLKKIVNRTQLWVWEATDKLHNSPPAQPSRVAGARPFPRRVLCTSVWRLCSSWDADRSGGNTAEESSAGDKGILIENISEMVYRKGTVSLSKMARSVCITIELVNCTCLVIYCERESWRESA